MQSFTALARFAGRAARAVGWFGGALALAVLLAFTATPPLRAQDFPTGNVRFIVPFPAGGAADILARKISDVLSREWKKPVIIDNLVGGANIVGIQAAIRAPADGHTIILVPDVPLALYPLMYAKLPYNPDTDLAPIATLVTFPAVLVVNAKMPVSNFAEFVAYTRKNQVNYGSFGPGSAPHLHDELLKSLAKIDMLHVPYRGAAPLMLALTQNEIQVTIIGAGSTVELIKAGTLRALAIDGDSRYPLLPDVPTFKEAGLPGMVAPNWFALLAPAKTPQPIIEKINHDVAKAMKDPMVSRYLEDNGLSLAPETPAEVTKRIQTTREFWRPVISRAGIRIE
jgi:tripartite-type tricarboxylate transporter receptor subunit TctC